ncbi:lytic transglycosylase domain-containing protein [Salisediminibacterium beveridgei]|uniref:Transglycosylase SLT domain-containing protein n=1 Tax=Salisediminibacterium beveridgei TaxID=632773 RepID=A0A1D7QWX8_9BACI|nr:lytic transglycosylase domain-containing protein [Salisediminibacterium beveridgei]AOM83478.1 hypothetical protein BBEV_2120 [Salisediminibacterium beveridgei]
MKKLLTLSTTITVILTAAILALFLSLANSSWFAFEPPEPEVPERVIAQDEIPGDFIPLYQEAGAAYEIPWQLLAAVHRVETIFSTMDPLISPAGAEGHMQFMPCTWTGWSHPTCGELGLGAISETEKVDPDRIARYGGYGVDATDSGTADPFEIRDAIFSAAHYLASAGAAEGDIEGAIYDYNRADWYVDDVLSYYERYRSGYSTIDLEEEGIQVQHVE